MMLKYLKSCILLLFCQQIGYLEDKPNIVVFLADDIGLGDIGFYQQQRLGSESKIITPNIDQLIKEGMRFSDAHSPGSVCAPTRFSMMTGNYPFRNRLPFGVWGTNAESGIFSKGFTTSALIAKAGGYKTSFFGKWGMGSSWLSSKVDYKKLDGGACYFGFDYACELPVGIQGKPFAFYENQDWMPMEASSNLTEISSVKTGYSKLAKRKNNGGIGDSNWRPSKVGPILIDKAVKYIDNYESSQPFFMYYCSQAVHIPHEPPSELDHVKIAGTTTGPHGDIIKELDIQVGMLLKALKRNGLNENTLFIFTSDNGGLSYEHDSSNGMTGKKGSIWEGGHRVPFIAVWKDMIPASTESNEPIMSLDIVATIAELSQQTLDRKKVLDSVSLVSFFKQEKEYERHKNLMHQSRGGPNFAIREGDWKLVMKSMSPGTDYKTNYKLNEKTAIESLKPIGLYNLAKNIDESQKFNLLNHPEHKELIVSMMTEYKNQRQNMTNTFIINP